MLRSRESHVKYKVSAPSSGNRYEWLVSSRPDQNILLYVDTSLW